MSKERGPDAQEQEPNFEEAKAMIVDFYDGRIAKNREVLVEHFKRAGIVQQELKNLDSETRRLYEEAMSSADLVGISMELINIDKAVLEKAQAISATADLDYFLETLGREVVRFESPEQPEHKILSMVSAHAEALEGETRDFWNSIMAKERGEIQKKMDIIRAIEVIKSKI